MRVTYFPTVVFILMLCLMGPTSACAQVPDGWEVDPNLSAEELADLVDLIEEIDPDVEEEEEAEKPRRRSWLERIIQKILDAPYRG